MRSSCRGRVKHSMAAIDNRRMLNCLTAAQSAGIKIATLFETTVANPQRVDGNADPDTVFRWLVDVVTYTSHPRICTLAAGLLSSRTRRNDVAGGMARSPHSPPRQRA